MKSKEYRELVRDLTLAAIREVGRGFFDRKDGADRSGAELVRSEIREIADAVWSAEPKAK